MLSFPLRMKHFTGLRRTTSCLPVGFLFVAIIFECVGKEMAPSDIRYANQDVRINLGFPIVQWPPILCLAKDEN